MSPSFQKLSACLGVVVCATTSLVAESMPEGVLKQLDVAPVWSVHQTGRPILMTRDDRQYVLYYDHDRFMTIAARELGGDVWQHFRFPAKMGWQTGSHANLSLGIDRDGYLHVTCYRRGMIVGPRTPPRAIYYRSEAPHSIEAFERLPMVPKNVNPNYPTFYAVGDDLFFRFRRGGSGRGDWLLNRYDPEQREWRQVLAHPLIDGERRRGAYPEGPIPGPDGRFHVQWVWRETSDHASNHSISYARTVGNDLTQWESAAGEPVSTPFTIADRQLLIDPAEPGEGLSNVLRGMSWDSQDRAVISYHRFDENEYSQIYNARFQDGEWLIVPATQWTFIWGRDYVGSGALNIRDHVRMSRVRIGQEGELMQDVWNRDDGGSVVVLDEETLLPLRQESPQPPPEWRRQLSRPESDFIVPPIPRLRRAGGPMHVDWIADRGDSQSNGVQYYLRWEHAGSNRDGAIPEPWPEPSMLRLYKVQSED